MKQVNSCKKSNLIYKTAFFIKQKSKFINVSHFYEGILNKKNESLFFFHKFYGDFCLSLTK